VAGYHIEGNIAFSAGTAVAGQVADNISSAAIAPPIASRGEQLLLPSRR